MDRFTNLNTQPFSFIIRKKNLFPHFKAIMLMKKPVRTNGNKSLQTNINTGETPWKFNTRMLINNMRNKTHKD